MGDFYDYLDWRGDLTFEQSGLNEVDCLILAYLSYLSFGGIVSENPDESITLAQAAALLVNDRRLKAKTAEEQATGTEGIFAGAEKLLIQAVRTPRFAGCRLSHYVRCLDYEKDEQFAAVSIQIDADKLFVSYSGTDETILGWKESLNMGYLDVIPGQRDAAGYLADMGNIWKDKLILGGHSKGGNLAVYAGATAPAEIRSRIYYVFDFDGPGFRQDFIRTEGYQKIRERIRKFVPETSLVGMLLEQDGEYSVVKTSGKGFFDNHLGYSWQILGPNFVRVAEIAKESRLVAETMHQWLEQLPPAECRQFIDTVYKLLTEAEITTIYDITTKGGKLQTVMKEYRNLSPEEQKMLEETVKSLGRVMSEYSALMPIQRTLSKDIFNLVFKHEK